MISVIIPVYNAADFVAEAVYSALNQKEVLEVILVEDGSPDGSLAVCKELEGRHKNVRLFRHKGGRNRGAGASRNLGIKHAQGKYVAFLDADDVYLANRFKNAASILESSPHVDGVYEAGGRFFEDSESEARWLLTHQDSPDLVMVDPGIEPADLFDALLLGGKGLFLVDGLTVRASLFEKAGYFDETLIQAQDTHMLLKMAAVGHLVSGLRDQPVARYRIHAGNRSMYGGAEVLKFAGKWRERLYLWGKSGKLSKRQLDMTLRAQMGYLVYTVPQFRPWRLTRVLCLLRFLGMAMRMPSVATKAVYWRAWRNTCLCMVSSKYCNLD